MMPIVGGLAGQYLSPMLMDTTDTKGKMVQHAAVGAGAMLAGAPTTVAVGAAVADFGLCKLYESVESLDMLTPVRGGIAVAASQVASGML